MQIHRRRLVNTLPLVLFIAPLGGLVACGTGEPTVVGKWKDKDGSQELDFTKDGYFRLLVNKGKEKGQTMSGKWHVLSDGKIGIETSMMGVAVSMSATASRNSLQLEYGGIVTEFSRSS